MRQTLLVVAAFAAAVVLGHAHPQLSRMHSYTPALLTAMMLIIGFGVGLEDGLSRRLRRNAKRVLLIPIFVVVGSLTGAALVALAVPGMSVKTAVLCASGLGYYSASGAILSAHVGPVVGAVGLLSNILRELLTLAAAPLLARFGGRGSVMAAGGATSMDTCLGAIRSSEGSDSVSPALVSGLVLTLAAPILTEVLIRVV